MKCCMRNNASVGSSFFFLYPVHLSFTKRHCVIETRNPSHFSHSIRENENEDEDSRKMHWIKSENDCVMVQVSRWALDKRSIGSFRCLALSPRDSILWERARTVVHARIGRAIRFIRLCAESIGKLWKPSSSCFAHRPSVLGRVN